MQELDIVERSDFEDLERRIQNLENQIEALTSSLADVIKDYTPPF